MPAGRPTLYSTDKTAEICARLAQGEPLRSICADDSMPGMATVLTWLNKYPEFQAQYARAREEQADALADDIVRIADESPIPDGETGKIDPAWVAWQRNRVEARKWTASKLRPKKYGEKLDVSADIAVSKLTDEQLMERAVALAAKLNIGKGEDEQ